MIHTINGKAPKIHHSAFVARGAQVIGDVEIGPECSIWFNAVIRGDINTIRIGRRTNIQDGCILHVDSGESSLVVGSGVTVGHRAILHGCIVGDNSLIGMGAIVMNHARVGPYALVAAGCVVPEGKEIPEGVLAAGVPARVIRPLTEQERRGLEQSALRYVDYSRLYHTYTTE